MFLSSRPHWIHTHLSIGSDKAVQIKKIYIMPHNSVDLKGLKENLEIIEMRILRGVINRSSIPI